MTPAEIIQQQRAEIAELRATLAQQDLIVAALQSIRIEAPQSAQEPRTLSFRERHGELPPTRGIGFSAPLNTTHGLESIGNIINRRTAGK